MSVSKSARRPSARGRLADGSANPVDAHVGARMRLRRTLLGMSQETLGEALGLTFQQVQKYERGGNRIGASRLFDLARVLDVPVSYFFDDMPQEVKALSPAAVMRGETPAPANPAPAVSDPLTSRETLELVRNYYLIPERTRNQVYQLAKALARAETGDAA